MRVISDLPQVDEPEKSAEMILGFPSKHLRFLASFYDGIQIGLVEQEPIEPAVGLTGTRQAYARQLAALDQLPDRGSADAKISRGGGEIEKPRLCFFHLK